MAKKPKNLTVPTDRYPSNYNLTKGILSRNGSLYSTLGQPIPTESNWLEYPDKLDPASTYQGGSLTVINTVQGEGFTGEVGISDGRMVYLVKGMANGGEVIGYFNLGEMAAYQAFQGVDALKALVVETIYQWEKDSSPA